MAKSCQEVHDELTAEEKIKQGVFMVANLWNALNAFSWFTKVKPSILGQIAKNDATWVLWENICIYMYTEKEILEEALPQDVYEMFARDFAFGLFSEITDELEGNYEPSGVQSVNTLLKRNN